MNNYNKTSAKTPEIISKTVQKKLKIRLQNKPLKYFRSYVKSTGAFNSRVLVKKHAGRKADNKRPYFAFILYILCKERIQICAVRYLGGATIFWIRLRIPATISMSFCGNREKPMTKTSRDLLILWQSMFRTRVGQGHGSACVFVCHRNSFPRPESIQRDSFGQRVIYYDIDV